MKEQNILFYSKCSKPCINLIKKIDEEKLTSYFKFISVDNMKKTELPSFIYNIPTIVINGLTKPLSGKDAFDWVINQKYFNNETNNINKSHTEYKPISTYNDGIESNNASFSYLNDSQNESNKKFTSINFEPTRS